MDEILSSIPVKRADDRSDRQPLTLDLVGTFEAAGLLGITRSALARAEVGRCAGTFPLGEQNSGVLTELRAELARGGGAGASKNAAAPLGDGVPNLLLPVFEIAARR